MFGLHGTFFFSFLPPLSPTTSNRTKTGITEFSACVNVEGVMVGVSECRPSTHFNRPAGAEDARVLTGQSHAGIRTDKRELVDDGEAVGG